MNGPQLRDIVLPPDPGFWPPAPGWWFVAVMVLGLAFWIGKALLRIAQRLRRARQLAAELEASLAAELSPAERLATLSALLRRWSKLQHPAMAALQGDAWLAALDQGMDDRPFSGGVGRLLLQGPYQRDPPTTDLHRLQDLVRRRFLQALPDA
jgi:hypothetical protein